MKLKIKFPFVKSFYDFHYIPNYRDDLNEIFVDKIRCYECGFDGDYWGVFYIGKRPDRKTVKTMLKNSGFNHDENDKNRISHYSWE